MPQKSLIVDDELAARELCRDFLEMEGYGLEVEEGAQAALSRLAKERFDLVLTDLSMPVMDGLELTRELRSQPALAGMKILVLSAKAYDFDRRRAKEMGENLDTKDKAEAPLTFPNGCHIAEIEIDPDTGRFDIITYTAVDDCGNILDNAVVEGQVQGSIANGLGQASIENAVYDSNSGQLVTGSFMDYGMPRAHDMPIELREASHVVPATTNPLGVKGAGEGGTIPAPAAIIAAIEDALSPYGVRFAECPLMPDRIVAALKAAGAYQKMGALG